MKRCAAIVAVGQSDWAGENALVRAGGKPCDALGYGARALRDALGEAPELRGSIDGLVAGPTLSYERAGEVLGIDPRWGAQAGDAGQALALACLAIETGAAEVIALVHGTD